MKTALLPDELKGLYKLDIFDEYISQTASTFTSHPFENIVQYVKGRGASHCLIESSYIDKDYLSEFQSFYATSFQHYARRVTRVHIFRFGNDKSITIDDFMKLREDYINKCYLGFFTIRPTDFYRKEISLKRYGHIGRSYIDASKKHSIASAENEIFITCKTELKANILGFNACAQGYPFIQQDTNVGACAQSSLWMACNYLHSKFDLPSFTIDKITEMATRFSVLGPIMPSGGLYVSQMTNALRLMGYSPIHYEVGGKKNNEKKLIIYRYIESKFPVIIITHRKEGAHAFNIIGHTFRHSARVITCSAGYATPIGFIPGFVVQDDAIGVYNIKKWPFADEDIRNIIVPLPTKVRITAEKAEEMAWGLLQDKTVFLNKYKEISDHFPSGLKRIAKAALKGFKGVDKIILRTYLIKSSDFKNEVMFKKSMFRSFKDLYRLMNLPKWIWVVEISTKDYYCNPDINNRCILGEVIIDSTATPLSTNSIIAIHMPGYIYHFDTFNTDLTKKGNTTHLVEPNDKPYAHKVNV